MSSADSHPLVQNLKRSPVNDPAARQASLLAVNSMMRAATRAGVLLMEAKSAAYAAAADKSNASLQRAQQAAVEAYKQRTNAEVAKYRAAFAILAEEEAGKSVTASQAAKYARDAASQRIFIQKADYHASRRDQMVQAANATNDALKSIPPLPAHMQPPPQENRRGAQMYRNVEAVDKPAFNWRPSSYRAVQNTMFPADIRQAAGALKGFGDDTVNQSWGSSFVQALENSLAHGVAAAGAAAAQSGNQMAASNPTGGLALSSSGNLLNALSQVLGMSQQQGISQGQVATGASPWPTILLVGAAGVAAFAVYKVVF